MSTVSLLYSVCQYTPDVIRNEKINVAIVIHCPTKGYEFCDIFFIQNKKRLKSFDDEFDSKYINVVFQQLTYQFKYEIESFNEMRDEYSENYFDDINDHNFIENRTYYYANEFSFLEKKTLVNIPTNEISAYIEDLKKTYLYYDFPKKERITKAEVQRLLKKEVKNLNLIQTKQKTKDFFNNEVFDFEDDSYSIKALTLDYKQLNTLEREIKILHSDLITNRQTLRNKKIRLVVKDAERFQHNLLIAKKLETELNLLDLNVSIEDISNVITEIGYGT
ncbi:DUF3037 domain-containing protein [Tuanshanicoccus lijuaniae]|uniref:DUF3037 domain-containing protein n=1 Tax=Aerococcaceae bacterium zg-1292 TaxID=2774330 RepID=UPI001937BAD4|nr:DUF3037 domain-containing protein [Aerococcaceae bacterium zg-1292]QQA36637.1 DUF3037 domain-containing protein [Aerococcaceae bacterium zg-1292]